MQSIRARLGSGLFVLLLVLFLTQLTMVSLVIRHLMEEIVLNRLIQDGDSLLAVVQIDAEGRAVLPSAQLANVYQQPFSGHYFHIEVEGRDLHSRSLWDADLDLRRVEVGQHDVQYLTGPLGQQLMVRVSGYRKQGRRVVIAVAQDISDLNSDIRELQLAYAGVTALALLLLVYLQSATLRWGLAPVQRAQAQLQSIERGDEVRLDESAPLEIQPLVQEINRLLELLSQRLSRSRNALGNLAHALKTPLSVMTQLCDEANTQDSATTLEEMRQQLGSMRGLVERELKRARLAAGGGGGTRFAPAQDAERLIATLEKIYARSGLHYQLAVDPELTTPLDREDMLELLGNLLDNASKWARAQVWLTISSQQGQLCLQVEDDGPGVDEEDLQQLRQRGVRVDEATVGHGLGLAIVSDAVELYGGQMLMGRSPSLGGFMIRVCLPSG